MLETATKPQTLKLHTGQLAMLSSGARTTVVTAGQGGGKTTGGYYWLLANMRMFPGESHLLGFPDYGLLQRVILNQPDPDRQTIVQFLNSMGEHAVLHVQERRISCKHGQIFFASGEDLTGWEGAHVKTAWIDEFDLTPLEAYRRAMERTRMRQGYVLLTGTPRLVKWVHTELQPAWERNDPQVKRIQFPSTSNPRYSQAALEEARRLLPAWEFARLYLGELAQQEGGGVFRREWWRYYRVPPSFDLEGDILPGEKMADIVQVWDTAFKDKTSADYSCCGTWGRGPYGFYLLDVWRGKVEYPELQKKVIALAARYRPGRILVEDAASGQSLIQDLRRSTRLPVLPVKVDRDKYSRASAVTGMIEAGRVLLPEAAPWLHDYVEELASFPTEGWHDDQVDMTSMALGYFAARGSGTIGIFV